jgi:hypothetical protein
MQGEIEILQEVSEPQSAILESTASINLFLAGVGSGKTHLLGIKTFELINRFPNIRGFIAANTYLQLEHSTLFRIREYWKSIGVIEYDKNSRPWGQYVIGKKPPSDMHWNLVNHNFDDYYGIISFSNGAIVFVGSMDNYKAHDGKDIGWAVLDETKDTEEVGVKEVILARLRQKGMFIVDGVLSETGSPDEQYNPLFIATSPAKVDWINSWFKLESFIDEITRLIYSETTFFEKRIDNKFVTISSSYHNVENIGINYIEQVLSENTEEKGKSLIFANPFLSTGGEFYSSFNRLKNVKVIKYNKELPIHISFDQNTVPYNSASIWQVKKVNDLWFASCIDEIALENPRNSTEEVCEEFMMRYPDHKSGLFYYGDASGKNRSTMNKDFKHHYEIVAYKLRRYLNNGSDRTLFSNPSLVKRRDFINLIFEEKLPIRVYIDESCKKMIADLMYTKQALDGGKDKHIVTDKDSGEKYQKYGHFGDNCFVAETLITTDKGNRFIKDLNIGDFVLTRKGYKKVTAIKHNGIKQVNTYQIGNREVTCTPDHKIFATDDFIMVSSLICKNIIAIFEEKQTWIDKLLFTMGISSIDIQAQRSHQTEITTRDGLRSRESGKRKVFIYSSILRKSVKFQKVIQFITLTGISIIMRLRIMRLCFVENIHNIITKYLHRHIKTQILINFLHWLFQHQKHGIDQKREESGTANNLQKLFMEKNRREYVLNVRKNLKQTLKKFQNIAPLNAKTELPQENSELKKDILKKESAKDVGKHFQLVDGVRINSVLANVQEVSSSNRNVYDITVDEEHEFFANGILVHNCEYFMVEIFKNYYNG